MEQTTILAVVVVALVGVALFQMTQLMGLKGDLEESGLSVDSGSSSSGSGSGSIPSGGGSAQPVGDLPQMVGGC